MADVPAWLLVFQTVAAGGVGLAGSFIVPKSQQVARDADRTATAHAIMRDKAEQIFTLIGELNTKNVSYLMRGIHERTGRYTGEFDDIDLQAQYLMSALDGLIGTYYPEGVHILKAARQKRDAALTPITEEIVSLPDGLNSPEGRRIRVRLADAAASVNADYLKLLQGFMLEAVKPYSPIVPNT